MLFTTVFQCILLVSTALALPSSRYDARMARRWEGRQSQPNYRNEPSTCGDFHTGVYSANWAGALWDESAATFTSITGTFTVPTLTGPDGAASAWVGIDGDTCKSAILQTGVDFTIRNGETSYDAWYEWFPDSAYDFSGINITAGDVMRVTVTASSTTSGNATIENLTNGRTVSTSLNSTSPLCKQNAEWIVEDFQMDGGLVSFANFGTVTFTDAKATGQSGTSYTPSGATLVNIQQNNQVLTNVSMHGSSLAILYV
ncbi:peptidase A4 family-domain-containing protein [Chiua virens]|nr:peptidase A4 family-domain-containing protein [Chiua virens]